jgi:hypothetical protein
VFIAPWTDQAAAVHNDILYIVGESGDVWGWDGSELFQPTDLLQFTPRFGHTLVSAGDWMWMIGGAYIDHFGDAIAYGGVWRSAHGANWTLVPGRPGFPLRYEHTAVSDGRRIWVMGGATGGTTDYAWDALNDTWMTDLFPWAAARNWEGYE